MGAVPLRGGIGCQPVERIIRGQGKAVHWGPLGAEPDKQAQIASGDTVEVVVRPPGACGQRQLA